MGACTSGDTMGEVVIKLSGDGLYRFHVREGRVGVVNGEVVIRIVTWIWNLFCDRSIYVSDGGIKGWRNPIGLDVTDGPQKGERICINMNVKDIG
jgi:hypothetical protein